MLTVVTGTGTGIGKTHVTEALVRAAVASGRTAVGWKPVESGVEGNPLTDHERLGRASTFHVKPLHAFGPPVSPHLAAERAGVRIDLAAIVSAMPSADDVYVELPGGLFSPLALGPAVLNADALAALDPDVVLLVAPDRLGVLHEIAATTRAWSTATPALLVLVSPEAPDASTGTNGGAAPHLTSVPYHGTWPRADVGMLAAAHAPALLAALRDQATRRPRSSR